MLSRVCCSRSLLWLATVLMLISTGWFESIYAVFGNEVFSSDVKVATLLFTHMCLFSVFQLFSGTLIDCYGSKRLIPIAAFCVLVGMILQVHTYEHNFPIMVIISQIFLTFGSSFSFVGIGYLSYGFFEKSISGIMFGFAQMAYSISYAIFWLFSLCCELFLKQNFKFATWSMVFFQLAILLIMIPVSDNIKVQERNNSSTSFFDMILRIGEVAMERNAITVSVMAGIEFSIFFVTSSMLLYKASNDVGGMLSFYAWIGFAAGAPLSCWMHALLGIRGRYILLLSGFVQGLCLIVIVLLIRVGLSTGGRDMLSYVNYIVATVFGIVSGAHMVAFSVGRYLVKEKSITTYYAVVNGSMCVLSGVVVLALTALAEFYSLLNLLLIMAVLALMSYFALGVTLRKDTSL